MKITHIIPYFYPSISYGGPVNSSFQLAKAQQQLGHALQILTTDAGDIGQRIPFTKNSFNQINVRYFRNFLNTLAKKYNIYLPPAFFIGIRSYIKNSDIVHIHEYFTLLTVAGIFWSKIYKRKVFLQPRGSIILNQRGKTIIKQLFNLFFEKYILKNTHHFLVLSIEEEDYLLKKGINHHQISLINNGVDIDTIKKSKSTATINQYLDSDQAQVTIKLIYLGRLHHIKGLDLLLEAIYLLGKKKIKPILFLAGPDDGAKLKLQKIIQKKNISQQVVFTGLLNAEDKYALLKQCDIYVQVSRNEPFGISIAEAICLYKPVLISDQIGLSRIVRDQFGLITSLEPQDIANALETLITNKELTAKFIANAKLTSHSIFSWEHISKEIIRSYEQA